MDPWKKFSQKINKKAWYCCQKCQIVKEKSCEIFNTIAQFFEEKFFVKFLDGGKNFKFFFLPYGTYVLFEVLGAIYLELFS